MILCWVLCYVWLGVWVVWLSLKAPFFSDFNSLFHSLIYWNVIEGNSGFRDAVFRENEASENPEIAWYDAMLCPIVQKRARTRKGDQSNWILHKIYYLLALVLGYYQFAFINRSVSKFETMPKISMSGSLCQVNNTKLSILGETHEPLWKYWTWTFT